MTLPLELVQQVIGQAVSAWSLAQAVTLRLLNRKIKPPLLASV